MSSVHQILPCPVNCPSQLYNMMVECWNGLPSMRPPFSALHRRLHLWNDELTVVTSTTSSGADQSYSHNTSPNCPAYVQPASDPTGSHRYNQLNVPTMYGTEAPSGIGFHPTMLNSADQGAVWPATATSSGPPFPVNCYHVGSDAAALAGRQTAPNELIAANYFRHPSDASHGDSNCANPSVTANHRKPSSRASNQSSLSSANSECKSPARCRQATGWQANAAVANHGPNNAIDEQNEHQQSRPLRL